MGRRGAAGARPRRARRRSRPHAPGDPRPGRRGPAGRRGRELVRDPRGGLRLRRPGAGARGVRRLRSPRGRGLAAPARARLDGALGRRRRGLAHGAGAGGRSPHRGDHGLRPSRLQARVGEHRRPHPEHRRARAPGPPPRRAPARRRGAGRVPRAARGADPSRAAARRPRRRPRGDHGPPRRLDVPADPGGHLGPLLRLVHARAVRDAPRLPAAPQPAPGLRLVPLQQARPAHARRDRVPQALRAGRLPRLDDRLPAAVVRRAGVLLGLRDDDDRHGLPRPRRTAARRRAGRLRRHARRGRAARARSRTRTRTPRSGGARSSPTPAARSTCSRPTGPATAPS